MRRRQFLASTLASGLAPGLAQATGLAPPDVQNTLIVIDAISARTPQAGLKTLLTTLSARSVPAICIVANDSGLTPDHPNATLLRQLWADAPGLIDLAPYVPSLSEQRAYFQSRLASLAIADLTRSLGLSDLITTGRQITTLGCLATDPPIPLEGLRSVGVRSVLALPNGPSTPVRALLSKTNVLQLTGGLRARLTDAAETLLGETTTRDQNVIIFAADDLAKTPDLPALATAFAEAAQGHELHADSVLTLPLDILIRDGISFRRQIAVHLFNPAPDDAKANADLAALLAELDKNNLPYSRGDAPLANTTEELAFWVPLDQKYISQSIAANRLAAIEQTQKTRFVPGVGLVLRQSPGNWRGFDANGWLHIPSTINITAPLALGEIGKSIGATQDGVISIWPAGITTLPQRLAILRSLIALRADISTTLTSLPELIKALMPMDNLLPVYRRTESKTPDLVVRSEPAPPSDRDQLMQDAAAAWGYIDAMTNSRTGLCIPANNFNVRTIEYDRVTMWDVGSHLNGLMAAVDLGLIDDKDFTKRTDRVLRRIEGRQIGGKLLPPEELIVPTGRSTSNFNASDTCRLLASLSMLAKHRLGNAKAVKALVNSWALKDMVIDGQITSIKNKEVLPSSSTQYAHYSAQGLAEWGITAKSPYDLFTDATATDDKIALLETVARLGPVGTEPVLLEAMDVGSRPASHYVAKALFAGLIAEFERSGRLICPSETPLNRSPWFTYQGLQLDDQENPWKVNSDRDVPANSDDSQLINLAVSSKAAYLWAAVYPHEHSMRLLNYVREKARNKVGFASTIYVNDGVATENYSDINTNGIILQAIAFMLTKKGDAASTKL